MTRPDRKIVKTHYPKDNCSERLSFIFDADPNLCLVKNKIQIFFTLELDEKYIPENGFGPKQFSTVDVELQSQLVSAPRTRGDYYLNDWLLKKTNFSAEYMKTFFLTEGYFDDFNYSELSESAKKNLVSSRRSGCQRKDGKFIYQLMIIPTDGFLLDNKPLPPNKEMKLTLRRQDAKFSTLKISENTPDLTDALELKDCYAKVEYISSQHLRNELFEHRNISYVYDDLNVIVRSLTKGEKIVRMENLFGGKTPAFLFAGIMPTNCIDGNNAGESISLTRNDLISFDLAINGSSCTGYPLVR